MRLNKDLEEYYKQEDLNYLPLLQRYGTGYNCPRCQTELIPSVVKGYEFICLECEEDFYKDEVLTNKK